MLYDALRSTIAATPLPSHLNQVQYNQKLHEVLNISRTDDSHPWFSMEAHLRAVFRNYLREFIRSKNQLAPGSNTPGAVIPQANYIEQASAASAPPAAPRNPLADSTNTQQRGDGKYHANGGGNNKKRRQYENSYRRDYRDNHENRGDGQLDQPRVFSQQPYNNGGGQHASNFACVESSFDPAGPGNSAQVDAFTRHRQICATLENERLAMEALRIKDVEVVTQEITADNMLSGNTDVEVEFTTLDCDPLVSGITSYGSANGASSADVTFLRLHNLDYPAINKQKAADEAMYNLEYPALYEQKAADEALSAVNLPVNLDYPVHIKQKNTLSAVLLAQEGTAFVWYLALLSWALDRLTKLETQM